MTVSDDLARWMEATEEAVLVLGATGSVVAVNPVAEAALADDGPLVGRDARTLPGVGERSPFVDVVAEVRERGGVRRAERFSPAHARWYRSEVTALDGERVLVRLRDVTERRRRVQAEELRVRLAAEIATCRGGHDAVLRAAATLAALPDVHLVEVWARLGDHLRRDRRWWVGDASGPLGDEPDDRSLETAPTVAGALRAGAPCAVTLGEAAPELTAAAGLRRAVLVPVEVPGGSPTVIVLSTAAEAPREDHLAVVRDVHDDLCHLVARQASWRDLDRLFALSSELLAVVRRDGTFGRVNPALCALLGREEAELLGRPVLDHVVEADRRTTRSAIERGTRGHAPARLTNRWRTHDGEVRTLWWTVVTDPVEEVAFVAGRDVTDEEREHEVVAAQRDVLRRLAEGTDAATALTLLAQALERVLGDATVLIHRRDDGELRLTAAPSLSAPALAAAERLPVGPGAGPHGRAAATGDPVEDPDVTARAGGGRGATGSALADLVRTSSVRACRVVPLAASDGQVLGTLAVHRAEPGSASELARTLTADAAELARLVLERDRDRRRLDASQERLSLLAQATSDAIWDLDLVTGALWWGEGLETLFGHGRDAVEPDVRSWVRRIHPDDRDEVVAEAEAALAGDATSWSSRYRFVRADGSTAEVLDRGLILRDEAGTAVRMVGGMVDVSAQVALEQRALRSQRLESLGTLAGGIAHDLNDVLAPILLGADLLAERGEALPASVAPQVDAIRTAARHGADVLRQVLTFAAGVPGDRTPVDARELVAAVATLAGDAFPKDVAVQIEVSEQPRLLGDHVQLRQALLNLALNARDALHAGGVLRLTAATVDLDEAYVAMHPELRAGPHVRLEVIDTGHGMADDVLERAAEPFFTTKDPTVASGLGLSTAAATVRSHGGALDLDSAVGRGTTVTVHLPAAPAVAGTEDGGDEEIPAGDDRLVLVVEDDETVREVTAAALRAQGYRCLTARDGAEALALFARRRDDVAGVVTDLVMPVLDGVALTAALRRLRPDLPVLAVSGREGGDRRATRLPADVEVLRKPFGARDLGSALGRVLAEG